LYFKPLSGGRAPAGVFRAGTHESLVRIEGRAAQVQHVRISSLVFKETGPTFLKATEPLLRSDWKFHRVGAVTIENAADVQVEDSDFSDLGGQVVVSGNHIHDIGGTAVAFVGRPEAVRSPLFEYQERLELAAIDRTPGPRSDVYPKDSQAADNLIHDIGLIDKQATGIEISMAARIAVDHNSIYRVPRAGINIGDGNWGGHRITNNDVFDTVLQSGDHGAFNSWGRDRYWHPDRAEMDRRVAAHPDLPTLDAIEPIVMKRNRFRCDHGWDIDLDDGASNYVIEDNLLLAGGLKLREGFARTVRNNILVNGSFHPHVWFDGGGDVFESNLVMGPHLPHRRGLRCGRPALRRACRRGLHDHEHTLGRWRGFRQLPHGRLRRSSGPVEGARAAARISGTVASRAGRFDADRADAAGPQAQGNRNAGRAVGDRDRLEVRRAGAGRGGRKPRRGGWVPATRRDRRQGGGRERP
jgi:hypothetical protein